MRAAFLPRLGLLGLTPFAFSPAAFAEDGASFAVGADYSSGDYGTDTTTEILSVPFTVGYQAGDWSFKASLPWLSIDGSSDVIPGVGPVDNCNPNRRGRGNGNGNAGTDCPEIEDTTGSASGIGDLTLSATYALYAQGQFGIDLTGKAKVALADEDEGLGTGENDYGLLLDLYRGFGAWTVFGGVSHTWLGSSEFIELDDVLGANAGLAYKLDAANSVGAYYDWREATTDTSDERSELTAYWSHKLAGGSRLQLYAVGGLADGSPDWGAGANYRWNY